MRLFLRIQILLLAMVLPVFESAGQMEIEEIMEQLPPEMEAKLIDPLTVEKNPVFINGEHLKFKLGWGIFSVAKTSLQTERAHYGARPALKISLKTRTNSFADAIYKVRNESTAYMARDVSMAYEYRAVQNEGGRRRNSQAFFDTEALTARYVNHHRDEERGPVRILPGTFDPLGIVFFIRCLDFDVGDELVIPTSNGKEFFYTIVRVTDKVTRKFRYGRREAYVLEPDIKDLGGVFKRSPDGNIRFFMSADEEQLPLRMESEVAVGRFWEELVGVVKPE